MASNTTSSNAKIAMLECEVVMLKSQLRAAEDRADMRTMECDAVIKDAKAEIERLRARIVELEADLSQYKRLYDLRGKALQHPCIQCGHTPQIITLAAAKAMGERMSDSKITMQTSPHITGLVIYDGPNEIFSISRDGKMTGDLDAAISHVESLWCGDGALSYLRAIKQLRTRIAELEMENVKESTYHEEALCACDKRDKRIAELECLLAYWASQSKCTCCECFAVKTCEFAWDGYNTDGDCLDLK